MIDNEPHRLIGRHPVFPVKPLQIDWNGKTPQSALPPQVDVSIEVSQRQFAQGAMDRLAPTASCVVRFRNRTPASILAENSNYVVSIVLGFKIQQQRGITIRPQ